MAINRFFKEYRKMQIDNMAKQIDISGLYTEAKLKSMDDNEVKELHQKMRIDNMVDGINGDIHEALEQHYKYQLDNGHTRMIKDRSFDHRHVIKYDGPMADEFLQIYTDGIIRDLEGMHMREEITDAELDYIKENTDLN